MIGSSPLDFFLTSIERMKHFHDHQVKLIIRARLSTNRYAAHSCLSKCPRSPNQQAIGSVLRTTLRTTIKKTSLRLNPTRNSKSPSAHYNSRTIPTRQVSNYQDTEVHGDSSQVDKIGKHRIRTIQCLSSSKPLMKTCRLNLQHLH